MKTKLNNPLNSKEYQLIEKWPIAIQNSRREELIQEIIDLTIQRYINLDNETLESIINKSIYLEKQRIKIDPWKVDPPNEIVFWNKAKKKLDQSLLIDDKILQKEKLVQIIQRLIKRYAEEIVGHFNIDTFFFARKFLTIFFKGIFDRISLFDFFNLKKAKQKCLRHFHVRGDINKINDLFNHGTVVILPTHSSNLDSILIGFMVDQVAKLPAFSYGAGLNLFNNSIAAFYMNRLGAYRVDRRKKNPIYLDSLKNMSSISVEDGTNTIFFPGGTRSRDGAVETKLKLGLLGSVIDAQRASLEKGQNNKIFIVPLVVNYETVLEAGQLVEQHLKRIGKEQYSSKINRKWTFFKILKYARNILFRKNDVYFSFGEPTDVIGNIVNEKGESLDKYGNSIEIRSYFELNGKVNNDEQRESEYTKLLGKKVAEVFLRENILLPTHFLSFIIVNLLKEKFNNPDIFDILRMPVKEWTIDYKLLTATANDVLTVFKQKEVEGVFRLSDHFENSVENIVEHALKNGGNTHVNKPYVIDGNSKIISVHDLPVVIFYNNRLSGYELESMIKWGKHI
jgi:glycerol-3-phosphate O-acyltransferase